MTRVEPKVRSYTRGYQEMIDSRLPGVTLGDTICLFCMRKISECHCKCHECGKDVKGCECTGIYTVTDVGQSEIRKEAETEILRQTERCRS